jgi:dihydrofolate reductase
MRKLILSMMVSLDGFYEGPNHEIDWHVVDQEFNEYASDLLSSVDLLLFGRVTYELMAAYWPTPAAVTDDPIIAYKMNNSSKVVFSNTLGRAEWNNTRLVKGEAAQEVIKLKQQPGKDMVIFGSGRLVSSLALSRLIDEYRLFVNPIILGQGNPIFKGIHERQNVRLLSTRTFQSGNVLLCYQPDTGTPPSRSDRGNERAALKAAR